jgi:hypothetical protein
LQDGTSADEMHVWRINVLIRGVCIQVGASFLQNLDEALPIIKASIAAIDQLLSISSNRLVSKQVPKS